MRHPARPPRRSREQREWVVERVRQYLASGGAPTRDAFRASEDPSTGGCSDHDLRDCGGWAAVVREAIPVRVVPLHEAPAPVQALVEAITGEPPVWRAAEMPAIEVDISDLDYDDLDDTARVASSEPRHSVDATPAEMPGARGDRLLIIPDAHSNPGFDNARFDWLGRLIAEVQPEHILCLGDWFDLHSLSSYDKGKRSAENARVKADIEHGWDAMDRACEPWNRGAWRPKSMTFCLGNHEDRLDRIGHDAPELDGVLGTDSLKLTGWGWTVARYKEPTRVCGFTAAHYFVSGIMGRPIGGMNAAATILRLHHESAIVGHSHVYDRKELLTASGRRILAIVAGCWTHPSDVSGWNTPQHHMWRRVLTLVHNAHDGFGDVEELSYERVRERWGRAA